MGVNCSTPVAVGFSNFLQREKGDGTVYRQCGTYYAGDMVLCERHLRAMKAKYPQGWESYPGDVCRHGTYTGGCGADLMCHPCEMGYDSEEVLKGRHGHPGQPVCWEGEGNYRYAIGTGHWVRCGDGFAPVMLIRAVDLVGEGR